VVKWSAQYAPNSDTSKLNGSTYANKAQFKSIATMAKNIAAYHPRKIDGIVINGDLTGFGRSGELYSFRQYWRKYSTVEYMSSFKVSAEVDKWYTDNINEVYIGLGSQDYDKNVDSTTCYLNQCAIDMLSYMLIAFPQSVEGIDLGYPKKVNHTYNNIAYADAEDYKGSLSYSWKTCTESLDKCFLFFQLHNYPSYTKFVNTWNKQFTITDSLTFLKTQLQAAHGVQGRNITGVVINYHDDGTSFTAEQEKLFVQAMTGAYKIIAIFVAHNHKEVGFKKYLCVNGKNVPVFYSGSVPANKYMLGQFELNPPSPDVGLPIYYKVGVNNIDGNSTIEKIDGVKYDACTAPA